MKRLAVAALLAAAVLPRSAPAAEPSLAVQVARMTMSEESWKKMMKDMSDQTAQFIEASARRDGATIPPEFGARFAAEFQGLFTYQELMDMQAGLLAKHYTEPELKQLVAFYKTPLGQKVIRIMPEVSADVNAQMMTLMQQRMPAMMERLKPMFEAAQAGKAPEPPEAQPAKAPAAKATK